MQVNVKGRLVSEEEFGNIIVKVGANGEKTLLKDVARIELGAGSYSLRSLLNNKTAVAIPDLPDAGRECPGAFQKRPRDDGTVEEEFSRRGWIIRRRV